MKLPDPIDATCPRCGADSQHRLATWLALTVSCPGCGRSLADLAMVTKEMVDDWTAFSSWAEVLVAVEDALGITSIDDTAMLRSKSVIELTLGGLASLIAMQLPQKVGMLHDARNHVKTAAEKVIRRPLSAADFDRRLLDLVRSPWRHER